MMKNVGGPIVVWFRRDLRLRDHPALYHAARRGKVVPVYIWDSADPEGPGGAAKWWLHHSLAALTQALEAAGSRLIIRTGRPDEVLTEIVRETGAEAVYWNRPVEPRARRTEEQVRDSLRRLGTEVRSFEGSLLWEPAAVKTGSGGPYKVFTPFWNACRAIEVEEPLGEPDLAGAGPWQDLRLEALENLRLLPEVAWDSEFYQNWSPGERGAWERLKFFSAHGMFHYAEGRNLPAVDGTSRLSPHLHWGEISARSIWQHCREVAKDHPVAEGRGGETFLREIGWREFSHHLLFHFPETVSQPLRREFAAFPWAASREQIRAWQKGVTGYPIVDAGMRQLWRTGWMHNRVRMIVGSFLVKHLLAPWQDGASWFWDTLVDSDLANNTMGWQWTAGSGADAAPFFRIFNPVLQGEKFDPDGEYVRRWVPELSRMPARWIHQPWKAPESVRAGAGVKLGREYPEPMVDHGAARERALAAFQSIR